jgi:hypothetical protein
MPMRRKYIDELGIKFEDTPPGLNSDDNRQETWKNQREKYGFDERETWSLDYSFKLWLYERLCMFNDVNIIDTTYNTFEYEGKTLTFQECIDRMLEGLKLDLTLPENSSDRKQHEKEINDVLPIFALCFNKLWW